MKWLLCLVILSGGACSQARAAGLFVAPGGDDANPGTLEKPFATLERARDAARSLQGASEAVTVFLRGGRYELPQPLQFTPADSGTAGRPVLWCAYGPEKPVISGGQLVRGWTAFDGSVWAASVPWVRERGRPFFQLFVDGQRRTRARMPNEGSYFYSKRLRLSEERFPQCLGLTFRESDLAPLQDTAHSRIVLFHNWVNSFNDVSHLDRQRHRLTFARPAGIFFLGPEVRYFVEGVREALDAPGEWHLDAAAGTVSYQPLPEEAMARAEVIAPRLGPVLVIFQGRPEKGEFVEHLIFRGLSFQHSDADLSREYPHSVQGAHTQRGALFATGLRHSLIEDCEFAHLGEHGISLRQGCASNIVRRCRFHDLGGGGVYLSEGAPERKDEVFLTAHNAVDNNFIHDGGKLFRAACGVFLGGSASYNQVTHNEICDLNWMGVHLGWSWTGRAPAYTHHNEVGWNHIHHLGNGVLNDIGGIYTLGVSPGTVLHHNHIHHISRYERGREGYGGWGIYLDAGSSEIRVENNLVHDVRDGGLHLHCHTYPYGNSVVNNIFAYSEDGQLIRNADHEPDTLHAHLERNVVYNAHPRLLGGNNWRDGSKFTADRNCYWSESASAPDFLNRSFAIWQKGGRDPHGMVADPGFVNARERDFRLRPQSPILKLGFQPLDLSGAGLQGSPEWRALPGSIRHRPVERAPAPEAGLALVEDFEDYDAGEVPAGALTPEKGAQVLVTDCEPGSGQRCARFVDAAEATAWKPHWFAHRTPGQGKVSLRCAVKTSAVQPAAFCLELRDWPDGGAKYLTGPYLRFLADGTVQAGGTVVGKIAPGRWARLEISFLEGEGNPKSYSLRLAPEGGAEVSRADLPFRSPEFTLCTWCGFSGMDAKPAEFFVDDIRFE